MAVASMTVSPAHDMRHTEPTLQSSGSQIKVVAHNMAPGENGATEGDVLSVELVAGKMCVGARQDAATRPNDGLQTTPDHVQSQT
jgi:hypothetical protein